MNSVGYCLAIFTILLGTILPDRLAAQSPTKITLNKLYSYHQTGNATLVDYLPELALTATFLGTLSPSTQVELRGPGSTLFFTREAPLEPSSSYFTLRRVFKSHAECATTFPNGSYTVAVIANGVTTTVPITIAYDQNSAAPNVVNFDDLQKWDGTSFSVFWNNPPNSAVPTESAFVLERVDGAIAYRAGSTSATHYLSPTASAIGVNSLTSYLGEALAATITQTRILQPDVRIFSTTYSTTQTVSTRALIKRPPVITTQPVSIATLAGLSARFDVYHPNAYATYIWKKDGVEIPLGTPRFNLGTNSLYIAATQPGDAGVYTVTIQCPGGTITSTPVTLKVTINTDPPVIYSSPTSPATVTLGAPGLLIGTAFSVTPVTVQWFRNGAAIPGGNVVPQGIGDQYRISLSLAQLQSADLGNYYFSVTNSGGTTPSQIATLAVRPTSRLTNLSVLTALNDPTETVTVGYVLGGAYTRGEKSVVVRAVGPSLNSVGVTNALDDPKLELFSGSTKTGENDNWAGAPSLISAFTAVGAFPLAATSSKDAAFTASLSTRDNSVRIASAAGTGLVLAEIYDATPDLRYTSITPRLVNLSVLKSVGTGLTVGFTISGTAPRTVLIRAVGPTLGVSPFNIPGVVADPQLTLFDGRSAKLAENDNWGTTTGLSDAFAAVGAFSLAANSKDAALLTTLPPGGYSVQVIGVLNTSGVTLVEIYDLP